MNYFFYHLALFSDRFLSNSKTYLHTSRFARLHEMANLLTTHYDREGLFLGLVSFGRVLQVQALQTRQELGNVLAVAPTLGGKVLLAVSQLLTWPHSVIINDIKGDLFTQTAGFRKTLREVYVIDPFRLVNCYDPLIWKYTESDILSSATNLLYKANEG